MICLIPAGGGTPFFFTPLPEQVEVKYGAKYQTFDTISRGTVKVPRGTDVTEVSWSGEFFGFPRRNETIVNRMFWTLPAAARSIIEEYVEGREFSIGVIDYKALPVIEIAPIQGFYDYKNKYKAGSAVETCPAELPEEITKRMQHYAERVAEVLGLDTYSRSDFLLNKNNEIYCLEANTLPGMTPTSLLPQEAGVLGINFNQLCEKLIEISLKKYEK